MPIFGLYLLIGIVMIATAIGFVVEGKIDKHNQSIIKE